ncbi:TRM11 family SAM-dependent methyltransferase [Pseudonocardia alni]|uniref:TRM11 family SAM-dependent methyltransferase n=1 Tax=Pseudonocardia alni TaxID=33907 RepID=UPI0033E0CDFA
MNGHSSPADDHTVPVSPAGTGVGRVWWCAQRSPVVQRRGRLGTESVAHPARMLPDLAAHAIAAYSRPGDLVLDPMCGIGTTLVEAVHARRRAIGVELEARWARVSTDNLALAESTPPDTATGTAEGSGAAGSGGRVLRGDARDVDHLLRRECPGAVGDVALVLTSPPYGAGVHGQVTGTTTGVSKHDHHYAPTRHSGNLAHTPGRLAENMTRILAGSARVLRPDGRIVVVARPWRRHGVLVDLPGQVTACAAAAGLVLVDRAVAVLARLDDPTDHRHPEHDGAAGARLVVRASFFARHNLLRARAAGDPVHLIAHEDVYVFAHPREAGLR